MNRSLQGWLADYVQSATATSKAKKKCVEIVELEARVCFSASPLAVDLVPGVDAALGEQVDAFGVSEATPEVNAQLRVPDQALSSIRELVFIDASVQDSDVLVTDLQADFGDDSDIFVIDSTRDGLEQLTDVLNAYRDITAVHIVSHGDDATLRLGDSTVTSANLSNYAAQLTQWHHSLSADADILLYGCNLAATEEGQEFTGSLALLTGADVAASDDLTGSSELGADWEFEYVIGMVESTSAFSADVMGDWNHTLAMVTVDTTDDELDGDVSSIAALLADKGADGFISLREAVIAANRTAEHDHIQLGAGTFELSIGGVDDEGYDGDIDITQNLTIQGNSAGTTIIDANGINRVLETHGEGVHLNLFDVSLTGGYTSDKGGGFNVSDRSTATLERVLIYGNTADRNGGGLAFQNGSIDLYNVEVFGNVSGDRGGGVYLDGTATLTNVSIYDNRADEGGGIATGGGGSTHAYLENVTLSGNRAGVGGGIYAREDLTIVSSTVAFNRSTDSTEGGGIYVDSANVNVSESIISDNRDTDGLNNVTGGINSQGFNLTDIASGELDDVTDIVGDPLLAALSYNGGFVQTHEISAGSAAIDAGRSDLSDSSTDANGTRTNQVRDIGAFENLTVSNSILYWADIADGTIVRGNPTTGTSQVIASGLDLPVGVTVDIENGKVYWTEVGSDTVSRANLDGSDVEVILSSANFANNPGGITVDPVNEKLYIMDTGAPPWIAFVAPALGDLVGDNPDRIIVSDLDGSNASQLLLTPSGTPTDLTIDYVRGQLYWGDPLEDSIYAANLDGSNVREIVSDAQGPFSLAVDFHGGWLYWTDNSIAGTDVLRRLNLDTGIIQQSTASIVNPIGMAFDQDTGMLFWSEQDTVRGMDTNNPAAPSETLFVQNSPFDIEAFSLGVNDAPVGEDDSFLVIIPDGATTTSFNGDVSTNDYDPDAESFVALLIDGPTNAQSFSLNTDGTFSYDPADGFLGTDTFTYRLFDGTSPSETVTVTLDVVQGTSALHNGPFAVVRGVSGVTLDASSSLDAPGLGLNYTWTVNTSEGAITATSEIANISSAAFAAVTPGTYDVTLRVTDGLGQEDIASTKITVFAEAVSVSGQEDASFTFQKQDFGSGYEAIRFDSLPSGRLQFDGVDVEIGDELTSHQIEFGNLTYEPIVDAYGANADSFSYDIRANGTGYMGAVMMSIGLDGTADSPDITSATTEEDSATSTGLVVSISSVDGSEVTHFKITNILNGTLSLADGTPVAEGDFISVSDGTDGLTFTPDVDFHGTTTFDVQASTTGNNLDLSAATSATIVVNPVNDAPLLDATATIALPDVLQDSQNPLGTSVAELLLSAASVTDVDGFADVHGIAIMENSSANGTWQFSLDGGQSWQSIDVAALSDSSAIVLDQSARVRLIPDPGFTGSVERLGFRVWDGSDGAAAGTVVDATTNGGTSAFSQEMGALGVNVIESFSVSLSVPADTTMVVGEVFDVILSGDTSVISHSFDSDAILDYTISSPNIVFEGFPSALVIAGANAGDRFVVLRGTEAQIESESLAFAPTATGIATFDFTVSVPGNIGSYAFDDLTQVGLDSTVYGNDLAGTGSIVADPDRGNVLYLDGTTSLTGTDNLGDPSSVTATAWINPDDVDGAMDVVSLGDNFVLRVDNGPDSKLIGFYRDGTGWQPTSLSIDLPGTGWHHIGYSFDSDTSTQTLYLDGIEVATTNHALPIDYAAGSNLSIGDHPFGGFAYQGLIDDVQIYNRALTPDQIAAVFAGTDSSTDQVEVTVIPPNAAPTVVDETATVDEDASITINNVLSNDTDPEGTTLSIQSFTQPVNGTVALVSGTSDFTYTPNSDFYGEDSFSYTVVDSDGITSIGTVTITVNAINDDPVAGDDSLTVDEGGITDLVDAYANDTDVDSAFTGTVTSGPLNGTINWVGDGTFTYTHDGSETTSDEFTYTIDDGAGGVSTATVSINISPINDDPVAVGDTYSTSEDVPLTIDIATGVLNNDSDAESVNPAAQLVSTTSFGSLALSTDGSFTYTPNADFFGIDSFLYEAVDSDGGVSDSTLVEINVTPVNDDPVALDDLISVIEGQGITSNVLANDTDIDGPLLKSQIVAGPNYGTLSLNTDGSFTYVHDGSETTSDSFRYLANDTAGGTKEATVVVDITSVNDAPVVADDSFVAISGVAQEFSADELVANDTDAEGDDLSILIVRQPLYGSVTLNPDGSITYLSADPNSPSLDSFEYEITDGSNTSLSPGTVFIEVVLPPPPPELPGTTITESATESATSESEGSSLEESIAAVGSAEPSGSGGATEAGPLGSTSEEDEELALPSSTLGQFESTIGLERAANSLAIESEISNSYALFRRTLGSVENELVVREINPVTELLVSGVPLSQTIFAQALVETMDSIGEDIDSEIAMASMMSGTIVLTTSSLSVGLVYWGVRLGYVVAGVLSSSSMWKSLDPNVISAILEQEETEDGAESLEGLLTR